MAWRDQAASLWAAAATDSSTQSSTITYRSRAAGVGAAVYGLVGEILLGRKGRRRDLVVVIVVRRGREYRFASLGVGG